MTIPRVTLEDQIKVAENSLENEKKRLKDRLKWVEEAQEQVELWEALLATLQDAQHQKEMHHHPPGI
jgi:DNA repair exonuclease SbcCD ATPase subunit